MYLLKILKTDIGFDQWSLTVFVQLPPCENFFENRPLPIVFALSENILF